MKKVFTDEFITWVSQAKQILEEAEIPCFLKNEYATSIGGEIPFFENWPELWIHRDSDYEEAQQLLQPLRDSRKSSSTTETLADWQCLNCGEHNEGQFALCWSCGQMADIVTT
ncbi:MAG: DUF2007 domain-containing protein [Xanthomonadales bacterium]|nr:DUF2007 domain-containing protein [Xanthomonadales bacterium]